MTNQESKTSKKSQTRIRQEIKVRQLRKERQDDTRQNKTRQCYKVYDNVIFECM